MVAITQSFSGMLTVQGPDGKPVQIPQNAAMQSLQNAQFNTNNTNIRGGKNRDSLRINKVLERVYNWRQ